MSELLDLVRRARAGDRGAFDRAAEAPRERARRFALGMGFDAEDAEDLAQETLQRAWAHLDQLEDAGRFSNWCLAIAVRLGRTRARRAVQREREGSLETVPPPCEARRGALTSLVRREAAAVLERAVDRLPIALREAFVLHHLEGLPYPEMAALTGVREGTLQVRAHRARRLLREQLGQLVDSAWLADEPTERCEPGPSGAPP